MANIQNDNHTHHADTRNPVVRLFSAIRQAHSDAVYLNERLYKDWPELYK
jgi:hypothetical protein